MAGSYIPLYRKYRPQKLSDLVGQEAIVKTLANAFELNKITHAYLLTGPRGTGKTSTARIFAKSLNCINGPTIDPCGVCPSCVDITNGNAIDVTEIDAASNRKVEDARNLLEKVQFVPVSGKYKVYIIDEVHMLTTEAFNTLLKTLEEPPRNLVFILATTEAHKVLNTIISRCQRFDFRRIKHDAISKRLREICELEKININDQALSLIAKRSGGGLRDALSLLDQASVLSSIQEEITDKDILTLLGSLNLDSLISLVNTIADRNTNELIKFLNEIINLGSEPVQIIRELMGHFRNLLLIKTAKSIEDIVMLLDIAEQYFDDLKSQADKFEIIEITQIIEKLSNFEKTLKTTSQQHLWLEVALISICHRYEITVIKSMEERIHRLEEMIAEGKNIPAYTPRVNKVEYSKPVISPQVVESKPVNISQPSTTITDNVVAQRITQEKSIEKKIETKPSEKAPVENEKTSENSAASGNLQADWKNILENIEKFPVRSFFNSLAKPVVIDNDKVILAFKVENFAKQAMESSKYPHFEKAVIKLFGKLPRITMRTALPEDNAVQANSTTVAKRTAHPRPVVDQPIQPDKIKTPLKENYEQISQDIEEVTVSTKLSFTEAKAANEKFDEEVNECIETVNKEILPIHISEQAKMIVDLFQGKIIET